MNDDLIYDEVLWCVYCKDVIEEGTPYVVDGENLYHPDCHKLLNEDEDPFEELRD